MYKTTQSIHIKPGLLSHNNTPGSFPFPFLSRCLLQVKRTNLKKPSSERTGHGLRVKFNPLALLLDASLEGEFDLVQRIIYEVNQNMMLCNYSARITQSHFSYLQRLLCCFCKGKIKLNVVYFYNYISHSSKWFLNAEAKTRKLTHRHLKALFWFHHSSKWPQFGRRFGWCSYLDEWAGIKTGLWGHFSCGQWLQSRSTQTVIRLEHRWDRNGSLSFRIWARSRYPASGWEQKKKLIVVKTLKCVRMSDKAWDTSLVVIIKRDMICIWRMT